MTVNVENGNQVITLDNKDLGELFLKPDNLGIGSPFNFFEVKRGVTTYIENHHLSVPSKIWQADTGAGWNASGTTDLSAKRTSVGRMKINFEMDNDVLLGTNWEDVLGSGIDINDLQATDEGRVLATGISTVVMQGAEKDLANMAFLNNYTLGATVTPSSFYTDTLTSIDTGLAHNGILEQIENAEALGNITEYSIASGAMTSTVAYNTLVGLYNNQSAALKGYNNQQKEYWVTSDIVDYYIEYLEALGQEPAWTTLVNGILVPTFRGIPVLSMGNTQTLLADSSEWNQTSPHRAILTVRKNFVVATNIGSDESVEFKMWYDGLKEEKLYIKSKIKMGFGYAHDELIVYGTDA